MNTNRIWHYGMVQPDTTLVTQYNNPNGSSYFLYWLGDSIAEHTYDSESCVALWKIKPKINEKDSDTPVIRRTGPINWM